MSHDGRRVYYDHEEAYARIAAQGGRGWDDLYPGHDPGSYLALEAFITSELAPGRGGLVLDLGCGGGQAGLLVARRTGCGLVGVDFSETAVTLARANAVRESIAARFERRDALDLGDLGPFDGVVDNHLLHCLIGPDRARALAEVRRVLRSGGTFFTETMTCEGGFDPQRLDVDPTTRIARNHSRFWVSRDELEAEVTAAGFQIRALDVRENPEPGAGSTIVVWAT